MEYRGVGLPIVDDLFIRGTEAQGFEFFGEVIGHQEVVQMTLELVERIVVIGFDRRVFQCAVHAFNLTVRPGMPELGEAMVNAKRGAGGIEGMRFAFGAAVRQQEFISELWTIVGQHRVDFVRHGFGQMIEERCRDNNGRRGVNLGEGELAGQFLRQRTCCLVVSEQHGTRVKPSEAPSLGCARIGVARHLGQVVRRQ